MFQHFSNIRKVWPFAILFVFWTILIIVLIINESNKIDEETVNLAKATASANFNKDKAIRFLVSSMGGVYVSTESNVKPNPALDFLEDRDIISTTGKKYTLVNPAYFMRLLNEYYQEYYGIVGHITSKKLMRSLNYPDAWEDSVLSIFEEGVGYVSQYNYIHGESYLRYMEPLFIKESCLKCHGKLGYDVGDVRGGISVSVPTKEMEATATAHKKQHIRNLLLLGLIGHIILYFGTRKVQRTILKLEQAQKKLQLQNEELFISKQKSEQSDQLKSEFLQNISHEIRTPLNGILGFTEILSTTTQVEDKQKSYIEIIRTNGQNLMRVMDDIIEISQLKTNQININISSVNIKELLQELYNDYKEKASKMNDSFSLNLSEKDGVFEYETDKRKLKKIIRVFLDNAIKYTSSGTVELGFNKTDLLLEIYVKDTGPGISSKNFEKIFKSFSQEESGISRKSGGLGLGLSIAKAHAQLIGAKIEFKSDKGKGSTFSIKLQQQSISKYTNLSDKNKALA